MRQGQLLSFSSDVRALCNRHRRVLVKLAARCRVERLFLIAAVVLFAKARILGLRVIGQRFIFLGFFATLLTII